MAFCANCGSKVGENDKFCASCGATRTPAQAAATPPPPPPPPQPEYQAPPQQGYVPPPGYQQPAMQPMGGMSGESSTGLKTNIASWLCYLGVWVTGIIFLVLEKRSQVVRFHAAQSLVFFGFIGILNVLLGIVFTHFWLLGSFLNGLIGLFAFIMWIILMVKAYQGEMYKIPIAGDIAQGIAGKG